MTIFLLMLWGLFMMMAARAICGRWLNHLSLYTITWSASLIALELRLIEYNHIVFEAWLYVFVAWVAIYLGTAGGRLIFAVPATLSFPDINMNRLRNAIFVLSAAGIASTVILAESIIRALSTENLLVALTEYANQIYGMRFEGEVSGLTYLNFLPYAGCVLAGVYTARIGRVTLVTVLPLLAMLADGIISMQRGGIIIGALLFIFSYRFTPRVARVRVARWRRIVIVCVMLAAFTLITAHRGVIVVNERETESLARVGESFPFVPSLYVYATVMVPCFSEYLKYPEDDGKMLWGRYMFASIYRLLSKIGFDTYVPYYQNFYYTPVVANTGTYLREIHQDFGASGIFIYPFTLGMLITFLESRARTIIPVILLSFLYLVVAFSIDVNFVSGGAWYFPLPLALVIAALVKKNKNMPINRPCSAASPA